MDVIKETINTLEKDGKKVDGYILSLKYPNTEPILQFETNKKHCLDTIAEMVVDQYKEDENFDYIELAISKKPGFAVRIVNTEEMIKKAMEILQNLGFA